MFFENLTTITFVAMQYLKLPAALRWAWVNCLILLLMMTAYRLFLVAIFPTISTSKLTIAFSGIVYDAGVVAFIGTVFMLLTWITPFHPYKSRKGVWFSFGYFSLSVFLLGIFYVLDLVSIKTFGQRLSGSKIISLFQGNPRKGSFFGNFPILAIITGFTLFLWLWWLLIEWLHMKLGMLTRAEEKSVRLLWYGLTFSIFFFIMFYSVSETIATPVKDLSVGRSKSTSLKVNPVLTFFLK